MALKKKVIFFTADKVPTPTEITNLDKLLSLTEQPFEVVQRCGLDSLAYGNAAAPEPCDLVAGTPIPTAYNAKPVQPIPGTAGGVAVVYDGQVIPTTSPAAHQVTLSINASGVITAVVYV